MKLDLDPDPMPPHKADCGGTETDGPCAACHWVRERWLDGQALVRWLHLVQKPWGTGTGYP